MPSLGWDLLILAGWIWNDVLLWPTAQLFALRGDVRPALRGRLQRAVRGRLRRLPSHRLRPARGRDIPWAHHQLLPH